MCKSPSIGHASLKFAKSFHFGNVSGWKYVHEVEGTVKKEFIKCRKIKIHSLIHFEFERILVVIGRISMQEKAKPSWFFASDMSTKFPLEAEDLTRI